MHSLPRIRTVSGLCLAGALCLAIVASCRPESGGDIALGISCGELLPGPPRIFITLGAGSSGQSGTIVVEPLAGFSPTGTAGIVEMIRPSGTARCDAPGGAFNIQLGGDAPVDGTLRIAAGEAVNIVVRTSAGAERAATSFDPRAAVRTQLKWPIVP